MKRVYISTVLLAFLSAIVYVNYRTTDISKGLAAYYPFNSSAIDESPNSNDGVSDSVNSCQDNNGIDNSAYYFNGYSSSVEVKNGLNFKSAFTFSFWIKCDTSGIDQTLFLKGEGCPDGNPQFKGSSYNISLSPENTITSTIISQGGNHTNESISISSDKKVETNKWYFIALSYDNAEKQFSFYIDGEPFPVKYTYKTKPENFSEIHETQASLKIGAEEEYCGYLHKYTRHFKGAMDEIRIYNRVLSEDEVGLLYDDSLSKSAIFMLLFGLTILLMVVMFLRKNTVEVHSFFDLLNHFLSHYFGRLIFTLTLIFAYLFLFLKLVNFSDDAFFGGDTWEYQSIAVNFANGHGVQKGGEMEVFEMYKFGNTNPKLREWFIKDAGSNNFYRTPGYPLFLGMIYKVFGISPLAVRYIQLLLLIIIASCLPWIGFHFWGKQGFLSGLIAGAIYLVKYYETAGDILTEPLIAFFIFLITVTYIYFQKQGNIISSFVLGIVMAFGLLVKGSLFFIPLLLIPYMLFYKNKIHFKKVLIVCSVFVSVIMIWSLYASVTEGRTIFLSTQSKALLMDSNNEHCVDGLWHPEWRNDEEHKQNYFYNTDGLEEAAPVLRVFNFYKLHPNLILEIFKNKLSQAFSPFIFLWIIIALWMIENASGFLTSTNSFRKYLLPFLIVLFTLSLALTCYFIFNPELGSVLISDNFHYILLSLACFFLILIAVKRSSLFNIPILFSFYFMNFLFFTLISYGQPRFIEVMDFVFILCAIQYIISFASRSLKKLEF